MYPKKEAGYYSTTDISFVVQGPILSEGKEISTGECLASIREFFPGAQIILSTWKGANITGLDYDVLVQSDDPGAQKRPDGLPLNVNRQIVSTREGLKKASRSYSVKMRTDSKFINDGLTAPHQHNLCPRGLRLFRAPIIITELYSRNPAKLECPLLFHPSDCFAFGRTVDLRDLWDIPLYDDTLVAESWVRWRFAPEQYIWTSFLNKHGVKTRLRHYEEFSLWKLWRSEFSIISNFAIMSPAQLGIRFSKPNGGEWKPDAVYKHEEWRGLCQIYGDPEKILLRIFNVWRRYVAGKAEILRNRTLGKISHLWIRATIKMKKALTRRGV